MSQSDSVKYLKSIIKYEFPRAVNPGENTEYPYRNKRK